MSSALLPRLAIRQSRLALQRRAQSSISEAVSSTANKAKETATETASKANQGLSKVSSSAGSAITSAANTASNAVSGIGGRTGALISWAQVNKGMIPPTIYYARVAGELGKMIVRGRGMAPPTMQNVQTYLQPVRNAVSNPSSLMSTTQQTAQSTAQTAANNPQSFLTRLRNMDRETLTSTGVIAAETVGFFCVGEMLGRFKIVGYRGGSHGEHH